MTGKEVIGIAYHRNGVAGDAVVVARVKDHDLDGRIFVAMVPAWAVRYEGKSIFDKSSGGYPCYVIDPEVAAGEDGTVEFGANSWRGDNFFQTVVDAARAEGMHE